MDKREYSERFDEIRKGMVETSFYKYGSAAVNFGRGYVDAIETAKLAIMKYEHTHNTEYLADAANYLMFEFMYPKFEDARYKPTDSGDSPGIVGISINEMNQLKEE